MPEVPLVCSLYPQESGAGRARKIQHSNKQEASIPKANGSFIMTLYCLPHSKATPLSTSPKSAQLRENKHKYNGPALGPWKLIYTLYSFYIYIHTHVHLRGNWQTWTRNVACHSSKQRMLPLTPVNKDQAISHCSHISQTPLVQLRRNWDREKRKHYVFWALALDS